MLANAMHIIDIIIPQGIILDAISSLFFDSKYPGLVKAQGV